MGWWLLGWYSFLYVNLDGFTNPVSWIFLSKPPPGPIGSKESVVFILLLVQIKLFNCLVDWLFLKSAPRTYSWSHAVVWCPCPWTGICSWDLRTTCCKTCCHRQLHCLCLLPLWQLDSFLWFLVLFDIIGAAFIVILKRS